MFQILALQKRPTPLITTSLAPEVYETRPWTEEYPWSNISEELVPSWLD
jgi:hypothetical protein